MEDGGPGDPALGGAGGVRASVRLDGRGPADLAPRAASLRRGRGARDSSRGQTAPRDETASAAAELERLARQRRPCDACVARERRDAQSAASPVAEE